MNPDAREALEELLDAKECLYAAANAFLRARWVLAAGLCTSTITTIDLLIRQARQARVIQ